MPVSFARDVIGEKKRIDFEIFLLYFRVNYYNFRCSIFGETTSPSRSQLAKWRVATLVALMKVKFKISPFKACVRMAANLEGYEV